MTDPAPHFAHIPAEGRDKAALLDEMRTMGNEDADYAGGRTWSMIYWAGEEHHEFIEKAHDLYLAGNGINPMAFKSLKQMEAEVVQMTAKMLHGPDTACGTMSSGGTESILLAVKAYRDRARSKWPWIRSPNMVVPETIHVAFDKAAHYFGVKLRKAPILENGQVDVKAMKRLINRNTIAIAASAPQYPHGAVDPIPEIGRLAEKKGLPFHVDACFGGFIQPWLERIGVEMPHWDFRVPGVTSMSADVHKYGYAAKGASIIVYRDMSYLRHQFYAATKWAGGIYISPTMAGTRPGGPIAAAWAAMNAMGEDGYIAKAKVAWDCAERLREGIEATPGLKLMGTRHSTIVSWASDELDVYAIADLLQAKGWSLDRQQKPPSIHCSVNAANEPTVEAYLADLTEAVAEVRAHPELSNQGGAAVYGLMAKVPVSGLVKREVIKLMEKMYAPGTTSFDLEEDDDPDDPMKKFVEDYGDIVFGAINTVKDSPVGRVVRRLT